MQKNFARTRPESIRAMKIEIYGVSIKWNNKKGQDMGGNDIIKQTSERRPSVLL